MLDAAAAASMSPTTAVGSSNPLVTPSLVSPDLCRHTVYQCEEQQQQQQQQQQQHHSDAADQQQQYSVADAEINTLATLPQHSAKLPQPQPQPQAEPQPQLHDARQDIEERQLQPQQQAVLSQAASASAAECAG